MGWILFSMYWKKQNDHYICCNESCKQQKLVVVSKLFKVLSNFFC